jgi:4-oxalocrotonate tautomerase
MPFVRVTLAPALAPAVQQRIAAGFTHLMAELLGKKAALTSVLVESPAGHWTIGGDAAPRAAHVEALVTQGTNSPEQKAAFLAAARDLLAAEVGSLPPATYVVVRDIPAGDWGYDGLSQAARAKI